MEFNRTQILEELNQYVNELLDRLGSFNNDVDIQQQTIQNTSNCFSTSKEQMRLASEKKNPTWNERKVEVKKNPPKVIKAKKIRVQNRLLSKVEKTWDDYHKDWNHKNRPGWVIKGEDYQSPFFSCDPKTVVEGYRPSQSKGLFGHFTELESDRVERIASAVRLDIALTPEDKKFYLMKTHGKIPSDREILAPFRLFKGSFSLDNPVCRNEGKKCYEEYKLAVKLFSRMKPSFYFPSEPFNDNEIAFVVKGLKNKPKLDDREKKFLLTYSDCISYESD